MATTSSSKMPPFLIAILAIVAVTAAKKQVEQQQQQAAPAVASSQEAEANKAIAQQISNLNANQAKLKNDIENLNMQVSACHSDEAQVTGKQPAAVQKGALNDTPALMNQIEALKNEVSACNKRIAAAKAAKENAELGSLNAQAMGMGGLLKSLEAQINSCLAKRGVNEKVSYQMPAPAKNIADAKKSLAVTVAAVAMAKGKAAACDQRVPSSVASQREATPGVQ